MEREKMVLDALDKDWVISMLYGIGEPIIITDDCGLVEFANPKGCELLEMSLEQITGACLNDIIKIYSETDENSVSIFSPDNHSKLLRTHLPRNSYIVNKSNEMRFVSAQITSIQSTNISKSGYAIVLRDVTQFVQAEKQIIKEKENLQKMFDLIPLGMLFVDEKLVIQKTNRYFYDAFGMGEKSVIGMVFGSGMECTWSFDFGCGNALNCMFCNFRKNIAEVINEGKAVSDVLSQLTYIHENKKATKWINFGVMPVRLSDLSGFMITLEDVTGRIEREKELEASRTMEMLYHQSQNKYESLFKNLENGICYIKLLHNSFGEITDAEVVEFNKATYNLFNLNYLEPIPNHISELNFLSDLDKEKLIGLCNKVIRTETNCQIGEYYISSLDKWVELSIYSPEDDYVALLITDIDFKKKAEIELQLEKERSEEANRAKRDFLANMSHEIRTPLNGIVGMIDLTMMDPLNHEQNENLNIAKECVDSLIGIINDVLDFSKIEAGKFRIDNNPFDLMDLMDTTYKLHQPHAGKKALEFVLNYESVKTTHFIGDSNRIKQVLNNLINNAIKFTDRGYVKIDVYETSIPDDSDSVLLNFVVSDTGIGIPLSKQSLLFKSFSQIDGSYTRQYGGTGLGLVISKQLTEMMGGSINVYSRENEGTSFHFSIPMKIGERYDLIKHENEEQNESFEGKKVLLVEDDKVNQIVMTKMLENAKIKIQIAGNGFEAIRKCNQEVYDLILMDIQMPMIDGIEVTRRIRKNYNLNQRTPIIALTAFALQGDEEIFRASGMDDYISKPIDIIQLMKSIDKHLNKPLMFDADHQHINLQTIVDEKAKNTIVMNNENLIELTITIERIRQAMSQDNFTLVEVMAHQLKKKFEELRAEELKILTFKMELEIRKEKYDNVLGLLDQIDYIVSMLTDVK